MSRADKRRAKKLAENTPAQSRTSPEQSRTLTLQQMIDLGVQHHNAGRLPKAEAIYRKILQANPDQPVALHLLGVIAHQSGKFQAAVDMISKAISVAPKYAEAYYNLGIAYRALGKLEEAAGIYQKAIAINPNNADVFNNLGNILKDLGRLRKAEAAFRDALVVNPDYAEVHNNLGIVLQERKAYLEAIDSYEKAIDLKPDYFEALNNQGTAFKSIGKLEDAAMVYNKALELNAQFVEAHYNLGNVCKDQGNMKGAATHYANAIALKDDYTEAHRQLSYLQKHTEHDATIKAMEEVYDRPSTTLEQRMHLTFGLGKAFEDIQEFEKGFEFLSEGNALKRCQYDYEIEDDRAYFISVMKAFNDGLFSNMKGVGCDDKTPVFVLGMPRSGTTLVEQILSSHPLVHGAGELEFLDQQVRTFFNSDNKHSYPLDIKKIKNSELKKLGKNYIDRLRKHNSDAPFIINKMPVNFKYIGFIKLILPNAKIIHCRRSPADTCLSIFKNFFGGEQPFAYDLYELGHYYALYQSMMDHWHTVLPGFIHDVRYEDMVDNQAQQTKALLDFCGLDWDEACLNFHKSGRPVRTASAAQVRKPMYKDSIDLWKRYQRQLSPLLEALEGQK